MGATMRTTGVATRLGELRVDVRDGATDQPVVVLWPSMFVDRRTFDRLVPLLEGRRLLVIDPPGLGESAPLRQATSIEGAAGAAVELLTGPSAPGLGVDGPVDWVGNAFGGHVGYELGVRDGLLRSLVAISAPPEPLDAASQRQIRLLMPVLRLLGTVGPVRSAILQGLLSDASAGDPAVRQVVVDAMSRPGRSSMALAVRSYVAGRQDVTALLPRLDLPCLFVASDGRGDWDPSDARRAAAAAPHATAVTIRGASTLVPLEQPEALAAALHEFWATLAR